VIKLNCVIIDDNPGAHTTLTNILNKSSKVGTIYNFESPTLFLKSIEEIDFNLCFLDCQFLNDELQGETVAFKLKEIGKLFIFISAKNKYFIEACRHFGAFDAMPKPNTEKRVTESLEKAYAFLNNKVSEKEPEKLISFTVAEERKGRKVFNKDDFHYIITDRVDHRNKLAYLKSGESCTLMDVSFQDILSITSGLIMINGSTLIATKGIRSYNREFVIMKKLSDKVPEREFLIGRGCRDTFLAKFTES
jgi:two-component system, LytTR family, response regulator